MSCIAIIPARGGSKRIKDKNIIDFCGKPMIVHVLETARNAKLFDEIHVSTDSERIAAVATAAGFPVRFLRSAHLCDDHTPLMPVLQWVLRQYAAEGRDFDAVCNILPCAPLIEPKDLVGGAQIFERGGSKQPVLAVAPFPAPPEWAFLRDENGMLHPNEPGMYKVRSQDLPPMYFDAGSFSYFPVDRVLGDDPPTDQGFLSVNLPPHKAIDIDEPAHLEHAEIIFLGRLALAKKNSVP